MTALPELVRQAGEAALLASSSVDVGAGPGGIDAAVLTVYGERLGSAAEAAVTGLPACDRPCLARDAALLAVAQATSSAAGQVIAELVVAHSLALVRLAEVSGRPLREAAADLVRLAERR